MIRFSKPVSDRPARLEALVSLTAAVLGGLVYLNALNNPFVYDDYRMVVDNVAIRNLFDFWPLLLRDVSRPLVNLSYAIDRAIWGPEPFGFHLMSVLLHMLNVALLVRLAWRLTEDLEWQRGKDVQQDGRAVVAFATGVLFAVHPMMTQAVGYIASRPEVLCTTFFLLGLLSARRWMRESGGLWWSLTAAAWLAALGTKEIAAMFPFVVLCYDLVILPADRETRR